MIDLDDEQLLNLVGIVLVCFLIIAGVILVRTAMVEDQNATAMPAADWQLTKSNESYVRITHTGGDPVQTDNLSVTVDGTPRRVQWTAKTLTEGESGIVHVRDASRVTLLWSHGEARRDVLERWSLIGRSTTSRAGKLVNGTSSILAPRPKIGPWKGR